MSMRKTGAVTLTGISLAAASSLALAQQRPEGLYSADQLLDADVYMAGSNKEVGEIEDIILDNNMRIKSFVVETEGRFGLGGKSYVVQPDQLSVEAMQGEHTTQPDYRITLDAGPDQLSGYPEYDDSWWNQAQSQAASTWEQTKASASSAWTSIRQGTADLLDSTGDAIRGAADETDEAAQDATQ